MKVEKSSCHGNCLICSYRWSFWKEGKDTVFVAHFLEVKIYIVRFQAVLVRALVGDIVFCSWTRQLTLTVPLSTIVFYADAVGLAT